MLLNYSKNYSMHFNQIDTDIYLQPFKCDIKVFDGENIVTMFNQNSFEYKETKVEENIRKDIFVNKEYSLEVVRVTEEKNGLYLSYSYILNKGNKTVRVCHLTSLKLSGLFGNLYGDELDNLKVVYYRSAWQAEGQMVEESVNQLHFPLSNSRDADNAFSFVSESTYTTNTIFPNFYFKNELTNDTYFVEVLPNGRYELRLKFDRKLNDGVFTMGLEALTGSASLCDFYIDLGPNETYETFKTIFGKAKSIDEANYVINAFKRSQRKHKIDNPIVFNDYLNCIWAKPNLENTVALVDKAAEIGADVYCMDSGWYKEVNETDWFGVLGDWIENDKLFAPKDFKYIISYINSKGMKFGIWFELEVATANSKVAKIHGDEFFVKYQGRKVYEKGRYFMDTRKKVVRDYLVSCVKRFYDMGVRYIKNDYNATLVGADSSKGGGVYGLEELALGTQKLYQEIYEACPEIIIENCSSGAMRSDFNILKESDLQSFSDNEEYGSYPAIIKGSISRILPEQLGVWVCCYPDYMNEVRRPDFCSEHYINERKDGRETIFACVSGFMGLPYVSGRIDKADETNLNLLKMAIKEYKGYSQFIANSYPVMNSDTKFNNEKGVSSLGLKNGKKVLLALWYYKGEQNSYVINSANVKKVYPVGVEDEVEIRKEQNAGSTTITFGKHNSAVLVEISE